MTSLPTPKPGQYRGTVLLGREHAGKLGHLGPHTMVACASPVRTEGHDGRIEQMMAHFIHPNFALAR